MILFIDIGNTNIKLCWNERHWYLSNINIKNDDDFWNNLSSEIKLSEIKTIVICSVVLKYELLIKRINAKHWNAIIFNISIDKKVNFFNDKDTIKGIGNDLIANAGFVASKGPDGILVVVGSSTSLVWIKQKIIQGIIICPGLKKSMNFMPNYLSKIEPEDIDFCCQETLKKKIIGNNTKECIAIGGIIGHAMMIEGLIKRIDRTIPLYISGGDMPLVKNHLSKKWMFVNDATILGMKIIYNLNQR